MPGISITEAIAPGVADYHKIKRDVDRLRVLVGTIEEVRRGAKEKPIAHTLPNVDNKTAADALAEYRGQIAAITLQTDKTVSKESALSIISKATTVIPLAVGTISFEEKQLVLDLTEQFHKIPDPVKLVVTPALAVFATGIAAAKGWMIGVRHGQKARLAKAEQRLAKEEVRIAERDFILGRTARFIDLVNSAPELDQSLTPVWNESDRTRRQQVKLIKEVNAIRTEVGNQREGKARIERQDVANKIESWLIDRIPDNLTGKEVFDMLVLTNSVQAQKVKQTNRLEVMRGLSKLLKTDIADRVPALNPAITENSDIALRVNTAEMTQLTTIQEQLDQLTQVRVPLLSVGSRRIDNTADLAQQVERLVDSLSDRLTPQEMEQLLQARFDLQKRGKTGDNPEAYENLLQKFDTASQGFLEITPVDEARIEKTQQLQQAALDILQPKSFFLKLLPRALQRPFVMHEFWETVREITGQEVPTTVRGNATILAAVKDLEEGSTVVEDFRMVKDLWGFLTKKTLKPVVSGATQEDPEAIIDHAETKLEKIAKWMDKYNIVGKLSKITHRKK